MVKEKLRDIWKKAKLLPSREDDLNKSPLNDWLIFMAVFIGMTLIALTFRSVVQNPDLNITMFYILGNFLVARYTSGYIFGFLYAILSVLLINFLFTYPYHAFNLTLDGYPVTFIAMLAICLVTSVLTTGLKEQARLLIRQEEELMEAQKEKMRANLLRAVSHDIRTPLTGIIGNSESYLEMEKQLSDEEKRNIIENIENDANWLLNMVENLLTVTRINNETAKVNKTLESVDDVVSSAIVRFKKRFPESTVKVTLPEGLVMVMMDPMLIEQVLINILQNAQVHAHSTRPLELAVEEREREVAFAVKDYGIGIEEERLGSIFDGDGTYSQESAADGNKGMGIGLSICKTIVMAHGGCIEAKNHGQGTTFVFSLPKETEEQ